jgi:RES domain-containing protein
MKCCPNCFAHPWLKNHVREISEENGPCDFCGCEDVALVRVRELAGLFHNLLSMYVVADSFESGEPLIDLIKWHWEVFAEDTIDDDAQARLLEKIANSDWDDDDGEPILDARELYSPIGNSFHTTHRERWEEFCSEVRDNPEASLPFDDFYAEEFALLKVTLPAATTLYRARRGYEPGEYGERKPFDSGGLAAPPVEKAFAGRANVQGQCVLYCADQERTAIAEVRPPLGYYVSVGEVLLKREVRILDLAKETEGINPFITESLSWHVQIRSLLAAFAEEMSRPLERDDDTTHYLPCQKLAEFIRENKYDGVRYPSAVCPGGTNLVLFDSNIGDVSVSRIAKITELTLEYEVETTSPFEIQTDEKSQDSAI